MPIPELDEATGYLPPGDHPATLEEVEDVFGTATYRRRAIMSGVKFVVGELASHGTTEIWINGSFVTNEVRPQDADVLYRPAEGEDPYRWSGLLSPLQRRELKHRHRVDLLPELTSAGSAPTKTLHEFFSSDRDRIPKGLVYLTGGAE